MVENKKKISDQSPSELFGYNRQLLGHEMPSYLCYWLASQPLPRSAVCLTSFIARQKIPSYCLNHWLLVLPSYHPIFRQNNNEKIMTELI